MKSLLLFVFIVCKLRTITACNDNYSCSDCVRRNCIQTFYEDKRLTCRSGEKGEDNVVFRASNQRHCSSMDQISSAWKIETTTSAPTRRVYLHPKLLPLATFINPPSTSTSTPKPITVEVTKSPTSKPFITVPIQISSPSTASHRVHTPTTTALPLTNSSRSASQSQVVIKKEFVVVNRGGTATVTLKKDHSCPVCQPCQNAKYLEIDMFSRMEVKRDCKMQISTVELYLRTLCSMSTISSPFNKDEHLLEMDKLYLLMNPARDNNHTCSILRWRKMNCSKVPKAQNLMQVQKEKKRRESNFFSFFNVTSSCNNNWNETKWDHMARLICRVRVLSEMIPTTEYSYYDMSYNFISPSYGYETICSNLFERRRKCYKK